MIGFLGNPETRAIIEAGFVAAFDDSKHLLQIYAHFGRAYSGSQFYDFMKKKLDLTWVRRLHPTKEGKRKYRFLTIGFIRIPLTEELSKLPLVKLITQKGSIRAIIKKGYITIYPNYAWNGCSPKQYVGYPPLGKWIGTPDFKATLRASLVHDILYQFSFLLPITFEQANLQFLKIMQDDGFCLAQVYYKAVELAGRDYWNVIDKNLTVEFTK